VPTSPTKAASPNDAHGWDEERKLALVTKAGSLLFANGQTTELTKEGFEHLALALGVPVTAILRWDEVLLRVETECGASTVLIPVSPLGIHMGKVAVATGVIHEFVAGMLTPTQVEAAIAAVAKMPPASTLRFAVMAGAGSAALGVIFGVDHVLSLVLMAMSAGLGGLLRRGLARISDNPFLQPFSAALLAGLIGAAAIRLQVSSPERLISICPCMVLVPGPHFLNGAIDLARARIPLGAARLTYAGLIVAAICVGLLGGLAAGDVTLSGGGSAHVAFLADTVAAGVAVGAYGTFFSMSWRTLPVPILIGMLAHASRWALMTFAHASPDVGAFVACLLAGALATATAERLHLPFAGLGFASVVSLIPGVFLFHVAGALVQMTSLGTAAPPALALATLENGTTAVLILFAMTVGLIVPRMVGEQFARRTRRALRD
jgi:uncharacterized membrane protein YjjP (DUF1212 family)